MTRDARTKMLQFNKGMTNCHYWSTLFKQIGLRLLLEQVSRLWTEGNVWTHLRHFRIRLSKLITDGIIPTSTFDPIQYSSHIVMFQMRNVTLLCSIRVRGVRSTDVSGLFLSRKGTQKQDGWLQLVFIVWTGHLTLSTRHTNWSYTT